MPPFIQAMLNNFSDCHGPNCFNSALNVNRERNFKLESVRDGKALLKDAYSKYRYVRPEESLRTGDLLVYSDESGTITHAASYVDDDIVFTKNGYGRHLAYRFENIETMENVYFHDRKFRLMVLRIPNRGEMPVALDALAAHGPEVYYWQHLNLEFAKSGLNPTASRDERIRQLQILAERQSGLNAIDELKRLSHDPRVADMHEAIVALMDRNRTIVENERGLYEIRFDPFGHVESNEKALEAVLNDWNHLNPEVRHALKWIYKYQRFRYEDLLERLDAKFAVGIATVTPTNSGGINCVVGPVKMMFSHAP